MSQEFIIDLNVLFPQVSSEKKILLTEKTKMKIFYTQQGKNSNLIVSNCDESYTVQIDLKNEEKGLIPGNVYSHLIEEINQDLLQHFYSEETINSDK